MLERGRSVVAASLVVGLTAVVWAQAPVPAAPDPLAPIRARTPTDADRQTIQQWLDQHVQDAVAQTPPDAAGFRQAVLAAYNADPNATAFREAFAAIAAQRFEQAITQADSAQPERVVFTGMMLSVLWEMNQPSALPAALAGMQHKAPLIRERSATLILRIRDRLAANDLQRVLPMTQTAATKEGNTVALRQMYQVLAGDPQPASAATAILTILEGRLGNYQKRDLRAAEADATAADALATLLTASGAQQPLQQRAVRRLAELLNLSVQNFSEVTVAAAKSELAAAHERALEMVIDRAEAALSAIAKAMSPGLPTLPSVSDKLKAAGAARLADMRLELNRWIGTPQTAGLLNAAPFNLPQGLPGNDLAAPTTAPAATTTAPAARP